MKLLLSLTLCLCLASVAQAQIYKTTDENGKVIYTDTPSDKAETVDLRETNVAPSSKPISLPAPGAKPDARAEPPYRLFINSPAPETHLNPGDRNLNVSFEASRALAPGLRYQVLSNGEPVGASSTTTSISIPEISRGEHQIHVIVYDQNQRVLAESAPVTVYVHRAKVPRAAPAN
jgi:hypothetical protein